MPHTNQSKISDLQCTTLIFTALIVATLISVSPLSRVWLVLPIGFAIVLAVHFVISESGQVKTLSNILFAVLVIYSIFIYHAILNPQNVELTFRVFIFIPVSFIALFIIPKYIDKYVFFRIISLVAGVIGLIGIPTAFLGNMIPYVSVHRNTSILEFGILEFEFHMVQSILSNPNPLGELLYMGMIASLAWTDRVLIKRGLFIICATGLFFTQSRAAFLAVVVALVVYIIGSVFSRENFHRFILLFLATSTIGYLMILRLIPSPSIIEQVHLTGRLNIWYAAIDAIKAQPLFGHGPGDMPTIVGEFSSGPVGAGVYNSFIRLFVTTGVIGGLCYLYIFAHTITNHAKIIYNQESLLVHALIIGFVINELFSGNSIFGLSTSSVIGALLIGYMISDITNAQN